MPYMLAVGLAKAVLTHGAYYLGDCRNASIARWNGETNRFVYMRTKFGSTFAESICHPDDDKVYDVFVAEAECQCDYEIPLRTDRDL